MVQTCYADRVFRLAVTRRDGRQLWLHVILPDDGTDPDAMIDEAIDELDLEHPELVDAGLGEPEELDPLDSFEEALRMRMDRAGAPLSSRPPLL